MKHRQPSINHTEPREQSVNHQDPNIETLSKEDLVIETDDGKQYTVGEIKHSNKIYKSATPKLDLSWYIKWISSILALTAVTFRASGIHELHTYDVLLSWLGAVGWFVVGFMWKDRALVLLNGAISIMLFAGLLKIAYGV